MNKTLKKLVLLPGMDGSGELFRGLVTVLPEELETETLWYPADRYMNYGELAGTLRGAIPVDEPFVLVAESYGAPLAVLIASLEPPNLKGIVLSAGYVTSPLRGWRRTLLWDLAPLLARVSMPGFLARYLLVGQEAPQALVELVTGAVSWVTPKVLGARVREVLNVDVRAELAQVKVPVLYLQPTKDKLVDPGCLGEMRAVKPGRTEMIESPHLLLQCEAKVAAEAITGFVTELGG
ncbi:alpha/beta fold hydrolase [Granulicella sp. L46]|jgi:pimeloyl-[acyl-carrier protein] methyl ester esterase|uniref:alpha/beta fold hydrolase n=1 Tax=Granulicella sp. L46 TaxID=1641865 RepID=UPI00131BAF0B|nr:alpha/beta hydrolase [Granulicella sp. L46]